MSQVIIAGDTSGTITLQAPAVSGSTTLTLPAATGTVMVSGNMPTFSYYQSSAQTLSANTITKLTFTSSEWDTTGGMFASSRFTPTIAGYYQIFGGAALSAVAAGMLAYVYKNGSVFKKTTNTNPSSSSGVGGSFLVYCNGSTDYIEIYAQIGVGQALVTGIADTYFQGVLVRNG
jgi:hypothetical protein